MNYIKVKEVEIPDRAFVEEGSWGERLIGEYSSTMTFYEHAGGNSGFIEWDIDDYDVVTIGLSWNKNNELEDYDGVMSLNPDAIALIESCGITVGKDFR